MTKEEMEELAIEEMEINNQINKNIITDVIIIFVISILLFICLYFKIKVWFIPALAIIYYTFKVGYLIYKKHGCD